MRLSPTVAVLQLQTASRWLIYLGHTWRKLERIMRLLFGLIFVAAGLFVLEMPAFAQSFPLPVGGSVDCSSGSVCRVVGGPLNGATGTYDPSTGGFTVVFGGCTVTGNSSNPSGFTLSPGCAGSSLSSASGQTLVRAAQNTSQVSVGAVQGMITSIRDSVQHTKSSSSVAMRYTWDANDDDVVMNYSGSRPVSKSPVFKAMPQPPMTRTVTYALWGQGFGDIEWRRGTFNGIDLGRTTGTVGALGGADVAITNILSSSDAFVIGVLGGFASAQVKNADGSSANVDGPGIGLYSIYVNGGFSTDATFKVDFFDLNRSAPGTPDLGLNLTNYVFAYNVNYKFSTTPWWIEPTIGFSHTSTVWDEASRTLGLQDGHVLRIQGGIRAGTSYDWNGVTVEPTLAAMLYSDVAIQGGTVALATGVPSIPTDEGKIFGQGIAKLNFLWNRNLSSYVEGEVRGREGVLGAAGRL